MMEACSYAETTKSPLIPAWKYRYPLPKPDDLFSLPFRWPEVLKTGPVTGIPTDEDGGRLSALPHNNMHQVLYQLPFGTASAMDLFQWAMDIPS